MFTTTTYLSLVMMTKCFECPACPERKGNSGVSERPGLAAAEPAGFVLPVSPVTAAAPELDESELQAQPAVQKSTEA